MVAIRTFLGVAALATAVIAAPTASKEVRTDCGDSGCGSDMSKMDMSGDDKSKMSSDCVSSGGSGCDDMSKMDDSNKSDCGDSGCGDDKKMDMGSDCGSSGCGDDKKMDDSKMSDCGDSGCGDDKKMDSGCGESGCDKNTMSKEETSTSMMYESTSTSSATYSTATYGSGSSNWKMYDDCVQQCVAKFGKGSDSAKSAEASMTASATIPEETATLGSGGTNGVTHTVVVAPTQGVLRFMPFAVNASIGDTIRYEWHANNHTVTKGSALELCNKSEAADTFASGQHNKGFTYLQAVNTTDPTYFYCATAGHCAKGMFGVINPKSTNDPALNMEGQMDKLVSGDEGAMAAKAYNDNMNMTANNVASTWGASISLEGIDPAFHSLFAENVQLTRSLIAMNPNMVGSDGKFQLDTKSGVTWPDDLAGAVSVANAAAAAAASTSGSSTPAPQSPAQSSAATNSASPSSTDAPAAKPSNGARGLGVSGAAVAFVAVAASLFAL